MVVLMCLVIHKENRTIEKYFPRKVDRDCNIYQNKLYYIHCNKICATVSNDSNSAVKLTTVLIYHQLSVTLL